MTMELRNQVAVLSDAVSIDEAETLLGWMLAEPGLALDLTHCEHMHTAVLQLLLYVRPVIQHLPNSRLLRQWLGGALNLDQSVADNKPQASVTAADLAPSLAIEGKGVPVQTGGPSPTDSSLCAMFDDYLTDVGKASEPAEPKVSKKPAGSGKTPARAAKASESSTAQPTSTKAKATTAKAAKAKTDKPKATAPVAIKSRAASSKAVKRKPVKEP